MSALVDPTTGEVVADCTPDEARQLTERIRSTADALWQLLAEAHDRGAWRALGYDTFKGYVEGEFQMSKRHAYRLLDQARVIDALTESAGVTHGSLAVPERTARELHPLRVPHRYTRTRRSPPLQQLDRSTMGWTIANEWVTPWVIERLLGG